MTTDRRTESLTRARRAAREARYLHPLLFCAGVCVALTGITGLVDAQLALIFMLPLFASALVWPRTRQAPSYAELVDLAEQNRVERDPLVEALAPRS